jgi:hypothetical protein
MDFQNVTTYTFDPSPLVTCDQLSELLVSSVAAEPLTLEIFMAIFVRERPILQNFVTLSSDGIVTWNVGRGTGVTFRRIWKACDV